MWFRSTRFASGVLMLGRWSGIFRICRPWGAPRCANLYASILAGVMFGCASSVVAQQTTNAVRAGADEVATTVASVEASEPVTDTVLWKRAIDRDDTVTLRQLLGEVDVKLTNDKGKTALMAAAKTGELDLLQQLQQLGLSIEDRSYTGGTSLMYAALGKQQRTISYLLDARRNSAGVQSYVDAESTNGWTAVMIAAAKGFQSVVAQLVEEGNADPWLADAYQWTPLMRAIDNRHTEVVAYLLGLDNGPLNLQNENGATALHVAAERGDVRTAQLLLERGADTKLTDNADRRALDIARDRNDAALVRLLNH